MSDIESITVTVLVLGLFGLAVVLKIAIEWIDLKHAELRIKNPPDHQYVVTTTENAGGTE